MCVCPAWEERKGKEEKKNKSATYIRHPDRQPGVRGPARGTDALRPEDRKKTRGCGRRDDDEYVLRDRAGDDRDEEDVAGYLDRLQPDAGSPGAEAAAPLPRSLPRVVREVSQREEDGGHEGVRGHGHELRRGRAREAELVDDRGQHKGDAVAACAVCDPDEEEGDEGGALPHLSDLADVEALGCH